MGSHNSKTECIWLPGQSGKTRNIMERIKALEVAAADYDCNGFLNIIICSNNRSLVDQTDARMNSELYNEEDEEADSKIEGNCFKWHSGLKKHISFRELADVIKEDEVNMVVCCAHSKRLSYLYSLIQNLDNSRKFTKRINVWIDEADVSINLWSKETLDISSFSVVHKITLVSATFDKILKKYGKIRVVPFLETTLPMYHRVQDCLIYENNAVAEDAPSYLMAVYEKNKRIMGKPGIRLFAPGDVERASHYKIADYLSSQGFAVVVLNGERKEVRIPGRANPISLGSYISDSSLIPEEIGKEIAKIYHDNNLSQYPFAITGHLCLGRGITFQNDQFIFTHGIIFTISDKANAYQTACRLAGNIKDFPNYNEPHLYTTSKMSKIILEKEETAINIARLVAERELSEVDQEFLYREFGGGKVGVNYAFEFYKCNKNTFKDIKIQLYNKLKDYNIKDHTFKDNYFEISEAKREANSSLYPGYMGNAGGWIVITFDELKIKYQSKGGHSKDPHLVICYNNKDLGIALIIPTAAQGTNL